MSWREAVSRQPPLGCGRQLQGPQTVQGEWTASDVLYRKRGKARSERHCHLPSVPGGTRGVCIVQEEQIGELEKPGEVLHDVEHHMTTEHRPASMVLGTKRKMKPAINTIIHLAPLPDTSKSSRQVQNKFSVMSAAYPIMMRSTRGRNVTNCWSHAIVCITNHPEAPLQYRPQTRSDR